MLSAWITGIVGVICLGVLLEIVLPEGQTSKYVKGAFSLLVVFVIAAPLPNIIGALKNWEPTLSAVSPDEGFLQESSDVFADGKADDLKAYLALSGYETEVKVVIKEGSLSKIERIDLILYLSVLEKDEENKHISKVRSAAAERLSVAESSVTVQGRYTGGDGDGSA